MQYVSKPSHAQGNSRGVLIIFLCLLMFLGACKLILLISPRLSNMTTVWLLYVDCQATCWPYQRLKVGSTVVKRLSFFWSVWCFFGSSCSYIC